MPVYKGWNVEIYFETTLLGYASEVRVDIDHSIEEYFPAGSRIAERLIEGPIKITGRLARAWVNVTYLSLLTSTTTLIDFDLKFRVGNDFTLYLYDCKFNRGAISIPQDGILTEDYDFIALKVGVG